MLIDTHAHLDQEEFDADRADVIARAVAAGVEKIVAIGVTADSSAAVVRLAADHPQVYAAVGIQPNYCGQAQTGRLGTNCRTGRFAESCGDRRNGLGSPLGLQLRLTFSRIISIGICGWRKNATCRLWCTLAKAMPTCWRCCARRESADRCGVMHSFTGTAATAAECVQLGLYISFAGMVTFKKSGDLREVATTVPDDRILIETDSPYLSPDPLRGKRNEPANLIHTARMLAEVRKTSFEEFARQTTSNARALFRMA